MLTGDVFVDEGLITAQQLQMAINKQLELGGTDPIAHVMVQMGIITEKDRVRCLGKVWEIPYIEVLEVVPKPDALEQLDGATARRFKALPLAMDQARLIVAMSNPLDVFVIDELRMMSGREVQPVICLEEDLLRALADHYKSDSNTNAQFDSVLKGFDETLEVITEQDPEEDDESDNGVIKLATLIINQAVTEGASDIHIEPRKHEIIIRFRIDGVMMEWKRLPRKVAAALTSRFKIVANMDIAEKRAPQDNRISAVVNNKPYDFRVSTLPVVYGEKIVMRVLDKGGISIGLAKLGFLDHNLHILEDMAARSYGICLVTGPTGSGKSTTLYSLLNQSNDGLKNIITIEDPVEYELEGINQCAVNNKAGMTFAAGLRAMLRQDPDVIMVGEMRDTETATIAMEAALTGHLVFSTLHTNDAPSAPGRLTDMEVEPFLISSSIIGVLAQRLVRQVCPHCKTPVSTSRDALIHQGLPLPDDLMAQGNGEVTVFKGRGCDRCKGTGYKGRSGIHELMVMTDDIRDEILKKSPSHILRKLAVANGMKTLQHDAVQKILLGTTSVDEVMRVIYA
ncbi:MAG: Flp pilus assembly complex ATPase component TadA [Fimbriimonadaceae bacterium]|jgi:type IV pilus assembly protein PilB|nr:Flp pilus assembly complex ATPase component TadA [Fimbriimonadaceae bacterium]